MNKHYINGSEIDKVYQRLDGAYLVSCKDGMEFLVPAETSTSAFHALQAWIDDGGVPVVITGVDMKTAVADGVTTITYTIHVEEGDDITVVSNREDPEVEETWVQAWEGLGGEVKEI